MEKANITKNDLMEQYSISLFTIDLAMRKGSLPFYKVGKSVRFSRQGIQEFIKYSRIEKNRKYSVFLISVLCLKLIIRKKMRFVLI